MIRVTIPIDMKSKQEKIQEYNRLIKLVDKAEKRAIEFVRKNLQYDPELRIKYPLSQRVSFR